MSLEARRDRLAAGLADRGCAALLVVARSADDPDLAAFAGSAHVGECFLVAKPGAPPALGYWTPMEREEAAATGLAQLTPEALEVERWRQERAEPEELLAAVLERGLALAELEPGRIALAGGGLAGVLVGACARLSRLGWTFVPGNDLVMQLRQGKTAAELAAIRHAAAGTVDAFRSVAGLLAAAVERDRRELWLEGERLTVARLRAEVARVFAGYELEQPRGSILAPREEGAVPHNAGTPGRVLRGGESLVVDLYPRGRMFADCTRTFCLGEPAEPLARGYRAVQGALELSKRLSRPGVRGWTVQEAVCDHLGALGYPTPISHPGTTNGYVHNLGHGVGFDLHEYPSFRKQAGAEGVLRAGDVITLEPGLYDPEAGWAVRLEDLAVVEENGLEILTPLPYELDPRAW